MLSESAEHTENEDTPQDQDSLFGSPPPSPSARGRSPSPALALPCASLAGSQNLSLCSSAQNVGTIALPGSHSHSEPSVNPIAPSLSLPGGSCTPFLPQPIPSSQPQSRQSSSGCSLSPRISTANRPSQTSTPIQIHSHQQKQTRRSAPKRKVRSATPRPPPPVIPLPDPSQPPPANFLRNQQALLGHAGLIAGVKPSKLTTLSGSSRGASSSNPIILDDNEGYLSPEYSAIDRSYLKNFDRSKLSTPTIQEVVDVLIKQQDIFPVLQSILKLLAAGATGEQPVPPMPPGWVSRPVQGQVLLHPSIKRRKLNRVPAGAADWDVPFPFMDGEGPEAYRQTWLKERGRQLISQVIGLVKIAIGKAAAKRHIEQLQLQKRRRKKEEQDDLREGGKGANHYRLEARGASPLSAPPLLAEDSPSLAPSQISVSSTVESVEPEKQSSPMPATPNPDNAAFSDLISALLSASESNDTTPFDLMTPPTIPSINSHPTDDILFNFDLSSMTDGSVDQSLVDSWMNILQTFPQPIEGSGVSFKTPLESMFGVDTPPDFSAYTPSTSGDLSTFSTTPNLDTQQTPTSNFSFVENLDIALNLVAGGASDSPAGQSQVLTNFALDVPVLSHTNATRNDTEALPVDILEPCVDGSKASPSSTIISNISTPMMDIDPLIDATLGDNLLPSSTGATRLSRVAATGEVQNAETLKSAATHTSSSFLPSPVSTLEPATPSSAGCDTSLPEVVAGDQSQAQDIEGQFVTREIEMAIRSQGDSACSGDSLPRVTLTRLMSQQPPTIPSGPVSDPTSMVPVSTQPPGVFSVLRVQDLQPQRSTQRSTRKPKKAEVLKKAEERRAELKARLEDLKVKLWEATIEHGALLHLMRLSGAEQRQSNSSTSDS